MIWTVKIFFIVFKLSLFFCVCYLSMVSVTNGMATLTLDVPFSMQTPEEHHPWFCWLPGVLIGIAAAHLVDWGATYAIVYALQYVILPIVPIEWQRPFYNTWKEKVTVATQDASPLIAYPMLAFIELELDKHFEEGGLHYAQESLLKKSDEIGQNLIKGLTEIGEEALRRNQAKKELIQKQEARKLIDLPPPNTEELDYVNKDKKIIAIKLYRARTNCGYAEAKNKFLEGGK